MSELIARRLFTRADQVAFADRARDWNPVHLDPVAARRTVVGEVVVHGMHVLLWALEQHLGADGPRDGLAKVKATFLKPVFPGQEVSLSRAREPDGSWWLQVNRGDEALTTLRIVPGVIEALSAAASLSATPAPRIPRAWSFDELRGAQGNIPVEFDPADLARAFPRVAAIAGAPRIAAFMALSRLVGMEMPGAHSLFAGIDVKLTSDATPQMRWTVTRHVAARAPLTVAVAGSGLEGTITAFMRPPPVAQPSLTEALSTVVEGCFAEQHALVVGGSRGLGETTAKLVAAGGGSARITYHTGAGDAERVVQEIRGAGRQCDLVQFDAQEADDASLARILDCQPTHIYYFASPRIAPSVDGTHDSNKAALYQRVYVDTFARLCRAAATRVVRVLYPSSVFVSERPRGFAEYVAAKEAGEAACAQLDAELPNLRVLCARLPRLKTDQTASFIGGAAAEPLPVLLKLIGRLHTLKKGERYLE